MVLYWAMIVPCVNALVFDDVCVTTEIGKAMLMHELDFEVPEKCISKNRKFEGSIDKATEAARAHSGSRADAELLVELHHLHQLFF